MLGMYSARARFRTAAHEPRPPNAQNGRGSLHQDSQVASMNTAMRTRKVNGMMKISPEDMNFLWKDEASGGGGCPALYDVRKVQGGYIVQGKALDNETKSGLRQLADDEDAVFVPANVLDRLRDLG